MRGKERKRKVREEREKTRITRGKNTKGRDKKGRDREGRGKYENYFRSHGKNPKAVFSKAKCSALATSGAISSPLGNNTSLCQPQTSPENITEQHIVYPDAATDGFRERKWKRMR